jgi:hypothetical protein
MLVFSSGIDFLFASAEEVPTAVRGIERLKPSHAPSYKGAAVRFRHRKTGIHVDAFTPADLDIPPAVLAKVFGTLLRRGVRVGRTSGPRYVKVASRSALVAMHLFCRRIRDEANIIDLVNSGPVDLAPFPLARKQLRVYEKLVQIATR